MLIIRKLCDCREEIWEHYFALNFAINLEMLFKMSIFSKDNGKTKTKPCNSDIIDICHLSIYLNGNHKALPFC